MSKFYITTPIYYVNDKPHLGHAYTTVAADVLARYHRMIGDKVFFLTGTDEHGLKIRKSAEKAGKTPQEWCDENSAKFELVWDSLNISYDNFIRTTNPSHIEVVKRAIKELVGKNLIYRGKYEGLYCVDCEQYYSPKELINGLCPIHRKKPVKLVEDCYFFKLSAFQKILLKLIDDKGLIIEPEERKNEVLGFLKSEKLEDIAITRERVRWGIPFPENESQTIYVWIEALLNYLTGIGWQGDPKELPEFWPPDIQLMAKDILRFHAVVWPAMLLALEIPLPKKIFAHGFFTFAGQKMSKSLGNIIDPVEIANLFSSDGLRYLLLASVPFGQDGDISRGKFYDRYNSDLANGLGNLVSRVLKLAKDKKITVYRDKNFQEKVKVIWSNYQKALEELAFEKAISEIQSFISFVNQFIDEKEPWKLTKTDINEFNNVIYTLLESLRHLAWLIYPFMPETSNKIFSALGIDKDEKTKEFTEAKKFGEVKFEKISQCSPLFPRL